MKDNFTISCPVRFIDIWKCNQQQLPKKYQTG